MNELFIPYIERHENFLKKLITETDIPAKQLKVALEYSLFPGGKKLRALLVYFCGEIVEANINILDVIATAIELIHSYSLIHDDLPAMDNDDLRRGRLSCHRAFDEATAILVGDGLQNLAFDILIKHLTPFLPAEKIITITHELIKATGFSGMISGQGLDITELNQPIQEERLAYIHSLKTGKLFLACITMVLAAKANDEMTAKTLIAFAETLGVLYQMEDDYLDRYHSHRLGKQNLSDLNNAKTTFASIFSKEELEHRINEQYLLIKNNLGMLGSRTKHLLLLIEALQRRSTN